MIYKAISQNILIGPETKNIEPTANTKKPNPVIKTPKPNFTGMEGSLFFLPRLIHILANKGAKITTAIGLMAWNQEALNSIILPIKGSVNIGRRIEVCANLLKEEPACSKKAKKNIAMNVNVKTALILSLSSSVKGLSS